MDSPFGLLAELTYRCPLACAYCSNPVNMAEYTDELSTDEWRRVLAEAADLGVLQCHLSGGEPLLRRDIVDIAAAAHDAGLYTNLVTSALGLSRARAEQLRAVVDHVQAVPVFNVVITHRAMMRRPAVGGLGRMSPAAVHESLCRI